jgi:hypothetical protein
VNLAASLDGNTEERLAYWLFIRGTVESHEHVDNFLKVIKEHLASKYKDGLSTVNPSKRPFLSSVDELQII